LEHHSPTGVFTDGEDLDGLFLPEEVLSDDASAGLLSACRNSKEMFQCLPK